MWAICEDRHGRLWVGTGGWFGGGNGISCFDGNRFITYTTADGLAHNNVHAICEYREGRLWFGTFGGGVSRFDGDRFTTYTTADGLAHNRVCAICEDREGRLWFGTYGGVSGFDGDCFTTYTTADGLAHNYVRAICEDREGRLWFGTYGGGVSCIACPERSRRDGDRFTTYTTADGLADNDVWAICEDREGRLWFGTVGGGVSCFDGERFITYTVKDGLLDNRVNGLLQDREGGLWCAHPWGGLTRFDAETVTCLTDHLVSEILIQDSQGRLWFGDENDLFCLCFDTLRTQHQFEGQARRQPFAERIYGLLEDSRGNFWVGTEGDGLYRYDSAQAVWDATPAEGAGIRHFTTADGLGSDAIFSLLEARDGAVWAGTEFPSCLCRFDGEVSSEARSPEGIGTGRSIGAFLAIPTPHPVVYRLYEDKRGRIWMGGWRGGGLSCAVHPEFCRRDRGRPQGSPLQTYTTADGLPDNRVQSIVEDDAGRLWMGTQEGLCCFDGQRFIAYGKEAGLFSLLHHWSAKDAKGQLWFGTLAGGLYRYDGVHFQWLTKEDGLPHNSITGLLPQPDGSMIIGTYGGILHYRPTATLPPRIEITEVVADRVYRNPTELELTATGILRTERSSPSPPAPLPQRGEESQGGVPLLTISYHGLSFATRQMRYSFILEGYHPHPASPVEGEEDMWQDTWENYVRYENLPVGEYTFKVIAINRDLVPSEAPATLKLTIQPDPRIVALQIEVDHLRREVGQKYHFENLIGRSAAIKQMRSLMEKAIDSGLTVLITGETGAGKERVAKAIHFNSLRKDKLMLPLNCGAMPKELIASTLFGHRKGAFTGAHEDKIGLFEAAAGGTMLLDEIGEMSQEGQVHLLRLLEERTIQRLGEYKTRNVDVRVIAMTNRDLQKDVAAGRFREDLYYRFNEFPIPVPPLQERLEDIPLLAAHFLKEIEKDIDGFGPNVFEMLSSHSWPGNVRELRNEIRRATAFVEEGLPVQTYHFSSHITGGESLIQEILSERFGLSGAVTRLQRRLIENALRECGGNRTRAAHMLGMDRANLRALMKRLGIEA